MEKSSQTAIALPPAALPYVLLQRTGYRTPFKKFFARLGRLFPYVSARLQSVLFGEAVAKAYSAEIVADFAAIEPHLPAVAASILDIGCGVGGLEVALHRHYPAAQLFLLDRTAKDRIRYGFRPRAAFYNSLHAAREVLALNGVPAEQITLSTATDSYDLPKKNIDAVISLLAWGFHFPIATYLDNVYDALNPGGVLIVDVREGTSGEAALLNKFGNCTPIHQGKNVRVVCTKRK